MNSKKITTTLIGILLAFLLVLCGCYNSEETNNGDPATMFVNTVLGQTIKTQRLTNGDYDYLEFGDGTLAIVKYTGTAATLSIPAEIDGKTVVALENKSFYNNETLVDVILPDTIKAIGNFAFMGSKKLESINFGLNIENIGISTFDNCKLLKTATFTGAPKIINEKAFYLCEKLTAIDLPAGVESIGVWAFAKCTAADKIILREGLKAIGDHAFLKCKAAKTVDIPGTCETIEVSAFYQCTAMQTLTLGEGVRTLKKGAFEECSALKTLTLPMSMTTLEKYAFYNCTALREVIASSGITDIAADVFTNDKNLTIKAPAGSTIAEYAKAKKIATVTMP